MKRQACLVTYSPSLHDHAKNIIVFKSEENAKNFTDKCNEILKNNNCYWWNLPDNENELEVGRARKEIKEMFNIDIELHRQTGGYFEYESVELGG